MDAILHQLMDIWVLPEIRRRQEAKALPVPLVLSKAQVVFLVDRPPIVRVNDEVRATYTAKLKEGLAKKAGDPVTTDEIDAIDNIVLTDHDDPDSAHITALCLGPRWFVAFDLLYNKESSRKHLETGNQFFSAAEHSFAAKNWAAFVDNAFSAAELYVKSSLLRFPDPEVKTRPTHRLIHDRFTRHSAVAGIDDKYVQTYNRLSGWRPNARYLKGGLPLNEESAIEIMDVIRDLRKQTIAGFEASAS